ncbi:MAG TPA: response regulator [Pseudobdellovibrionaceae bacterium]|nr:response regulator [Pseudobdellovibrionaceae bacterium]
MKVLIIDDEPLIRRSLLRAFKSKGYDVFEAENGFQGIDLWRKEKPDLVYLDILMPGMTGFMVLEKLGSARTGKVVLISAYSEEDKEKEGLADLFIKKPFEDIFQVVQQGEGLVKK